MFQRFIFIFIFTVIHTKNAQSLRFDSLHSFLLSFDLISVLTLSNALACYSQSLATLIQLNRVQHTLSIVTSRSYIIVVLRDSQSLTVVSALCHRYRRVV